MLGCVAILTYPLNSSYALDITLAWDANTEPDLAGYLIYYGLESSDSYDGVGAADGDSPIDMPLDQDEDPDPNVMQFTVYDLPEGTHVFAVTAYNLKDLQSDYSNEVIAASGTSDEPSTPPPQPQVSTSGGGGGGCFIATATCEPNAPREMIFLSLILLSVIAGAVPVAIKFRE